MDAGCVILGGLVGLWLAVRARARQLADLAEAYLDHAKVREIRRLLEERRWYGGVLHGVEIDVEPVVGGSWWVSWSPLEGDGWADGLVPDEQLDQELLRWLRGGKA